MTIQQVQCLLAYLGLYQLKRKDGTVAIDGLPGPATSAAIKQFQADYRKRPDGSALWVDGIWGPATENAIREVIGNNENPQRPSGKGYKWIDPNDFKCRCGGQYCNGWPAQPHKKTMDLLEQFGEHFQKRPVVHSGLRCATWNRLQGGAPHSRHKFGAAVDFHIDGVSNETLRDYAETIMPGWGGIGIYSWGIHIDDRPVKGRWDYRGR